MLALYYPITIKRLVTNVFTLVNIDLRATTNDIIVVFFPFLTSIY